MDFWFWCSLPIVGYWICIKIINLRFGGDYWTK